MVTSLSLEGDHEFKFLTGQTERKIFKLKQWQVLLTKSIVLRRHNVAMTQNANLLFAVTA